MAPGAGFLVLLGVAVAAGTGALGLGSIPGTHGLHGSARTPAVAPRVAASPPSAATSTGDRGPAGRETAAVLRTDATKGSGQSAPPATPRLQPVGNGPDARLEPVGDGPDARIPELIAPGQLLQPPPRVFPRSVWPSLPVPRTPPGPGSPPASGQTGAPVGTQTGGSPTTTDPAGATITSPLSSGSTQSSSTGSGGTPAVGSTDATTPTPSTTTDGGQGSGQQTTSTSTTGGGSTTTGSSYSGSTG